METPVPKKPQYKKAVVSLLLAWGVAQILLIAFFISILGFTNDSFGSLTYGIIGLINIALSWIYLIWPIFYFEKRITFVFHPWLSLFYGSILGGIAGIFSPIGLFALSTLQLINFDLPLNYIANVLPFFFILPVSLTGAFIGSLTLFFYTQLCYEKQRLFSPTILWTSLSIIIIGLIAGLLLHG